MPIFNKNPLEETDSQQPSFKKAKFGFDFLKFGSKHIFPDTTYMIDHYRGGSGKTVTLNPGHMEEYDTIRDAEKINHQRMIEALDPTDLENGKDEIKVDKDYAYVSGPLAGHSSLLRGDPDLSYSLGTFQVRSKGNLLFKKAGDKYLPYGRVKHEIKDRYDFNKGKFMDEEAEALEKAGRAKPFDIRSGWETMPFGYVTVKNGKVNADNIEWERVK